MLLKFLSNYKESLNEETLLEKHWVKIVADKSKITPKDNDASTLDNVFYFYSTNNDAVGDVNHLIDRLYNAASPKFNPDNSRQYGTYKQSLNPAAVNNLMKILRANNKNYSISDDLDPSIFNINMIKDKDQILTLADRSLRRDAEKALKSDKHPIHLLKPENGQKALIHHIDGREYNNDIMNIATVGYSETPGARQLADAAHKYLHTLGNDHETIVDTLCKSSAAANLGTIKICKEKPVDNKSADVLEFDLYLMISPKKKITIS